MKSNKINFTKATILGLPLPNERKISYYYDTQVNGLGIMIFSSGTITFFLYKRINGRPDKVKLGRFPDITIDQARKVAYSTINDIAQGINPKEEKNNHSQHRLFKILFAEYIEKHSKLHKKTWEQDEALFRTHLSTLANRQITDINKTLMMDFHSSLAKKRGLVIANRILSLVHAVYNKAIEWGWKGSNPCTGVKKFKERSRERFLQAEELPKFFMALNNEPNQIMRDFFYISLLTGARKGNVASMSWNDINLANATWHLKETKNGESQIIHLCQEALDILLALHLIKRNEIWVFPSNTSESGHLEEPKSAWKRLLKRAGIDDLHIHDLRRTLGSWQAATGANSYIIGKSLGHKDAKSTAIYARLNIDPVRESVNKATSAMLAFGSKGE